MRCGALPRQRIDTMMRGPITWKVIRLLAAFAVGIGLCSPVAASHLVTGNGFGFAVVAPESGAATKFYPHPHSFVRPDPANALSEGIETPNFIKSLGWGRPRRAASVEYVEDSHVIRMRRSDGVGDFFMPFGLERPALIIGFETRRPGVAWHVEWNRPLQSQTTLGANGRLLRFDG